MTTDQRGVYLVANDVVRDWFVALARTLRANNPDLAVRLIPFGGGMTRIARVAHRHDIEIWDDPLLFAELDGVGRRFHPANPIGAGMYRKFACFAGPFDRFVYLDSDMVVSTDVTALFDALDDETVGLVALDREPSTAVFVPGSAVAAELTNVQLFNAGGFAARRGLVALNDLNRLADDAAELGAQFRSGEQSCLNLLVHRSGTHPSFAADLVDGQPDSTFANVLVHRPEPVGGWPIVHWAGEPLGPSMSMRATFRRARCTPGRPVDAAWFLIWTTRLRPLLRSRWLAARRLVARRQVLAGSNR